MTGIWSLSSVSLVRSEVWYLALSSSMTVSSLHRLLWESSLLASFSRNIEKTSELVLT